MKVNYYGEASSTSGYGTAVRGYIHALHTAGVDIAVVDTGRPPGQVQDPLVARLLGRHEDADFNLIHAIPIFWPRVAYSAPNVIAITVWEADPIPDIWHRQLCRAMDVWVPCEFNVTAFAKVTQSIPFCLPYALPAGNRSTADRNDSRLGLCPEDFVFYSIFDWQYRKNPVGMIEAFLLAFPEECDAVLLLKTIARAAPDAERILVEARSRTKSKGRIILRCETFDDQLIEALHNRGDCYVSLHRGEGWGYPLFEAAARGTPSVASAQGGPLDFLDPTAHRLVPCALRCVEEPYFLFRPTMTWGEPDLFIARDSLRWVYDHRDEAATRARAAAAALQTRYSYHAIGEAAASRLCALSQKGDTG